MINLKQDVIRQLNAIYGMSSDPKSFKAKYKEEIKERIVFFVNKKFEKISFNELSTLKNYIELKDCEIYKIKTLFLKKYKEELLKTFNPLWYEEKEKIILTNQEKEYVKTFYLKTVIEKGLEQIKEIENKYRVDLRNTIRYTNNKTFIDPLSQYERKMKKYKDKNIKCIFRKEEKIEVIKSLKKDHENVKEALIRKINLTPHKIIQVYLNIVEEENFKMIKQELLTTDFKQAFCSFEIICLLKNIAEEDEKCI